MHEERWRLAVEATGLGTWEVDGATGRHAWSPEFRAICGLPPDVEPSTALFADLIHPDDSAWVNRAYAAAFRPEGDGSYEAEFRIRRADTGEERWVLARGRIAFGDRRQVVRGMGLLLDTTARRSAERALVESEERFRLAVASFQGAVFETDLRTGHAYRSPRAYEMLGVDEAEAEATRAWWHERIHPDDREGFLRAVEAAVAGEEERVDRHYRIRHASGDWIWIWHRGLVVRDRRGRPVKLTGAFLDVTGQKCAEGALQARTRELEIVLDTVPAGVWFSYDPQVRRVARNRYAATLTGAPDPVSPGPDDAADGTLFLRDGQPAPRDQLPLQRALRGDELVGEEYALRVPGGPDRILLISARALRDEADAIVGAVSIAVDITERKRADEERRLLVNELNHRVKNTLAIVQSLAAQTLRGHEVERAAAKAFTDRIANLARAHDLLTRESWEGVSLDDLVRQLAEPYDPGDRRRIAASGPPVRLEPHVALALAMALHELATNAAKYGSLSRDGGGVAVAWAATREGGTGRPTLRLRWAERGGPPVEPPRRRGFGTRLLERVLATEPGGGVTTTFAPDGLVCEIRLELADEGGVAAPVESP